MKFSLFPFWSTSIRCPIHQCSSQMFQVLPPLKYLSHWKYWRTFLNGLCRYTRSLSGFFFCITRNMLCEDKVFSCVQLEIMDYCFLKKKKILFIYFQTEGKGGRKRGRETLMCGCLSHAPPSGTWPATQACALTGNQTNDP